MSKTKAKPIRALFGFRAVPDADVLSRATAVLTGLTGNVKFPNPPVDLKDLKSSIDSFSAGIAAALDGSKKAITAKHREREALTKLLRQLATYVEANCNDDMATFTSSGFQAVSAARTSAQPLTQPAIKKVEQGNNTGELLVRITALPKARSYDLRYAAVANGTPGSWTTLTLTSVKGGVLIKSLTPGTIYAFQVRALGKLGHTDWTDSTTRMTI